MVGTVVCSVGMDVGRLVGSGDGGGVGEYQNTVCKGNVGFRVGSGVGLGVGWEVGIGVGCKVGTGVGRKVGTGVGCKVGTSVCVCVCVCVCVRVGFEACGWTVPKLCLGSTMRKLDA